MGLVQNINSTLFTKIPIFNEQNTGTHTPLVLLPEVGLVFCSNATLSRSMGSDWGTNLWKKNINNLVTNQGRLLGRTRITFDISVFILAF